MISTLLLIVIYIAFVSLGLPDSVLGAAWPVMHIDLGVSNQWAGLLSMAVCAGTVISSLCFSFIARKFKTITIVISSTLITVLSLFAYGIINSFYALFPFAFILGLGGGCIDAALNNYVSLHYKTKQMSFLHAAWGIGTIFGPFILAYAFSHGFSWHFGYLSVSALQFFICILLFFSIPLWGKTTNGGEKDSDDVTLIGYKEALSKKGAIFALLGFFCYCTMEASSITWSSTFVVSKGMSEAQAASVSGLLFAGITTGRILSGFIADKMGDKRMIRLGLAGILIGIVLMIVLPSRLLFIALFLLGFGYGPLYPSMIHQTPVLYGVEASATLIGIEMAAAYCGSTLMPTVFGLISTKTGMGSLPFYLLSIYILLLISTELKRARRN